jgi:PAS domain S-box-containing protein
VVEGLKAKILVVDDNPASLMALEATLAPLGQTLVSAASGAGALRHLLHQDFAVILLDVRMPGMDGYETAQLIKSRERTRYVPIIFLTAYGRDDTQLFKGYEHGAVDFLHKPIDAEVLRCKVSVFVDLYRKGETIKAQEARLREAELRALTDLMPLSLLVADRDGRVAAVNRAFGEFSGLSAEECGSLEEMPGVHAEDRDRLRAAWRRAAAKGGFEIEFRLQRRDGVYRWHIGRAAPERDEKGNIARWILTAADIDEQKQGEAARALLLLREQEARAEAEAANRAKDEFLATLSHELRTPLNAILGWTHILRTQALDPATTSQALETLERSARLQRQLIEDILDVSRIIAGKLRLEVKETDLAQVVRAAVDGVRPAATHKGVALELLPAALVRHFPGDPERLAQVLGNVLTNAVKFTPREGRVTVRLEEEQGVARLTVADTGIGIAPDFLPQVFERFRQADGSSARMHGGLGLGLSIARHLVELHRGAIRVDSPGPGQGTVVTITIPVRALADAPGDGVRPEGAGTGLGPAATPLAGLRVLVVDDSEDIRRLFATILERHGAKALLAHSAEEALARLEDGAPDVLLSDIGLPIEDGYSLIRRVRTEKGSRIPAAALTAYARADDQAVALEAGFQMHLTKPIEQGDLVAAVARLAGRAPQTQT